MRQRWRKLSGLAAVLFIAVPGCAIAPSAAGPNAAAAPPRVQDCTNVSVGSPTQYVCEGKVYTAYKLTQLREDWERKAQP
jgi:hypothetical protein